MLFRLPKIPAHPSICYLASVAWKWSLPRLPPLNLPQPSASLASFLGERNVRGSCVGGREERDRGPQCSHERKTFCVPSEALSASLATRLRDSARETSKVFKNGCRGQEAPPRKLMLRCGWRSPGLGSSLKEESWSLSKSVTVFLSAHCNLIRNVFFRIQRQVFTL